MLWGFIDLGLGLLNLAFALNAANTERWDTLDAISLFLAVLLFIFAGMHLEEQLTFG